LRGLALCGATFHPPCFAGKSSRKSSKIPDGALIGSVFASEARRAINLIRRANFVATRIQPSETEGRLLKAHLRFAPDPEAQSTKATMQAEELFRISRLPTVDFQDPSHSGNPPFLSELSRYDGG
jgi:hypothetical protein